MKMSVLVVGMALLAVQGAQAEVVQNHARKLRFLGLFDPPQDVEEAPEALDLDEMYTPDALDLDESTSFSARKLRFLGLFDPPQDVEEAPEALDLDEMYTPDALDLDEMYSPEALDMDEA